MDLSTSSIYRRLSWPPSHRSIGIKMLDILLSSTSNIFIYIYIYLISKILRFPVDSWRVIFALFVCRE